MLQMYSMYGYQIVLLFLIFSRKVSLKVYILFTLYWLSEKRVHPAMHNYTRERNTDAVVLTMLYFFNNVFIFIFYRKVFVKI